VSAPPRTIGLDNEAVQALLDPAHRRHRAVLAHLEVRNQRQRGRRMNLRVLVPVTVRIEAGWDRTATTAADVNRISAAVDVGQAAESATHPAAILASDLDDMTRLAGTLEGDVRVVGSRRHLRTATTADGFRRFARPRPARRDADGRGR
jgi:hypothetical protein